MLGLLLDDVAVAPKAKAARVPAVVLEELTRLKALYTGLQYRAWARMLFGTTGYRMDHQTVKRLWHPSSVAAQGEWPVGDYHSHPERYQARGQVLKLYAPGWTKRSSSQFLHGSRPTVNPWIRRFDTEHLAGLVGHKRGPKAPRKVWFPIMGQISHLQKAPPDAGEFCMWSVLASEGISMRTVGRVMALNRQVYDDISAVVFCHF
jgi:Winged helix-turn helix